jgi:hypothetical protein
MIKTADRIIDVGAGAGAGVAPQHASEHGCRGPRLARRLAAPVGDREADEAH